MQKIAQNLSVIHDRMENAASGAGRSLADIQLIAVSKTHPTDSVRAAIQAGQHVFGENRVQEAKAKFLDLRQEYPDLELHLIGPLQSNKAVDAVQLFDVIQTVDRISLADALAKAIKKTGRKPRLSIEINIGEEPQKAGIMPSAFPEFLDYCRVKADLPIDGIMCIPPHNENPEPYFTRMKALADTYGLKHISMGMSGDFEQAIACGATEVRVGTAIFGERSTKF